MTKLRGFVRKETAQAILFEIIEDDYRYLQWKTLWFPKSRIQLPKHLYGKVISIYIPEWLYEKHIPKG